jgi:hypothetical protein
MKRITLFLAALLLGAFHLNASVLTLLPSSATPMVGQTFTIDFEVTGNTNEILGFGLDYSVSTPTIVFQGFTINPFFGPDLGLGEPQISAITFPGATASTVSLVSFSFLANAPGSSVFQVTSNLNDPNQGLFLLDGPTADLGQRVQIDVQAAVPEPGNFSLAGLFGGLLLIAVRRRRVGPYRHRA